MGYKAVLRDEENYLLSWAFVAMMAFMRLLSISRILLKELQLGHLFSKDAVSPVLMMEPD